MHYRENILALLLQPTAFKRGGNGLLCVYSGRPRLAVNRSAALCAERFCELALTPPVAAVVNDCNWFQHHRLGLAELENQSREHPLMTSAKVWIF